MPARYEITPDAKRDIRSIWLYTEEHWGERQADRYTGVLDRCMDRIARRRDLSRRFQCHDDNGLRQQPQTTQPGGAMSRTTTIADALSYLQQHGACVEYIPDFMLSVEAERYMQRLLATIEFNTEEESQVRRPFSREKIAIPRRQTAYGDPGTSYTFAGCVVPARPWIPILSTLREVLRERTGEMPNFVLINFYRDGRDCIGWHADDERDLGDAPTILSLSLGATRDFQFRHREAFPRAGQPARRPELQTVTIPLCSGSLLIMRDPTNKDWKHQLPRRGGMQAATIGARLNFTWRQIVVRDA